MTHTSKNAFISPHSGELIRPERGDKNGYHVMCHHKKNGIYMYEHRWMWEKHNGEIPADHHIHHINHDKTDNRIENLECIHKSEHARRHLLGNTRKRKFTDTENYCPLCEKWLPHDCFYKCPSRGSGMRNSCIECDRAKQRTEAYRSYVRNKYATMSPEQKAARKERNKIAREKRFASETPEQRETRMQKRRDYAKRRAANLTPEQKVAKQQYNKKYWANMPREKKDAENEERQRRKAAKLNPIPAIENATSAQKTALFTLF